MANKQLWTRWTLANAFSEMFGLGLTFAITGLYFSRAGEGTTVVAIMISFVVAVASGAVEATFVGLAQWWAMRPRFPSIGRFEWWRGTFGIPVAALPLLPSPPTGLPALEGLCRALLGRLERPPAGKARSPRRGKKS